MNMIFAQATGRPSNGGSNAEDFQPPTRNPQQAPSSLQNSTGPQSTGVQEILNQPNVRIVVPKTTPAGAPPPPAKSSNMGMIIAVIAAIIIVVVVERFFRKRDRQKEEEAKTKKSTTVKPDTSLIETSEASVESIPKTEKKKKKSKSKRKNR